MARALRKVLGKVATRRGRRPTLVGPNLVLNGSFDSDLSSWTDASDPGASISWESPGRARLISVTGASGRIRQGFATRVGVTYLIEAEGETSAVVVGIASANIKTNNVLAEFGLAPGVLTSRSFVATTTTSYVNIRRTTGNLSSWVDNVSIREAAT